MDRYEKVENLKENLQKEKVGSREYGKAPPQQRTNQPVATTRWQYSRHYVRGCACGLLHTR